MSHSQGRNGLPICSNTQKISFQQWVDLITTNEI